jgi:HK97 family phage portal protein
LAVATESFGASFFANGASPSGVLEYHGNLGRDGGQNLRRDWDKLLRGSGQNRVAVLEEGLKYKPIGVSPEQAQFLETRKFQLCEVARIFRVPPHMIADLERSTYSNIEHQSMEFVKYSVNPWVKRIESAMKLALLSPSERKKYVIRFNVDAMLRGDYATRMEGYRAGRQNGWLSINDVRKLEDLPPIPAELGGDRYLVNGNMKDANFTEENKNNE